MPWLEVTMAFQFVQHRRSRTLGCIANQHLDAQAHVSCIKGGAHAQCHMSRCTSMIFRTTAVTLILPMHA